MNRLKQLREEKGLLLKDIAKFLGTSITAVAYYEQEKRDMAPGTIIKLSDYFDVSTDYLLGKSNIRKMEIRDIDENEIDVAFSSGMNGLNEENKKIIQATLEGLLAKQKFEEENKKNKRGN